MGMIPVLAAPQIDPGAGRIEIEAPHGLTLAELVALALPAASQAELALARVALVAPGGAQLVDRRYWHRVRPRPGVRVVIRILAGKNAIKSVLAIVISIAAIAIGYAWGAQFGMALFGTMKGAGAIGTALLTAGVTVLGNLALNALIPPERPESREARNTYSISGWQNRLEPDGAVPVLLGRMRYAPPYAAMPHTEIMGDDQYVRALFTFGEGPVEISDLRIGETSISEFRDVQVEIREGRPGDNPQTIIPRQIVEEAVGVDLTRPLPRNAQGDVISGQPSIETPVVRTTGADAQGASVLLAFPGGMVRFDDKGRQHHERVDIRIEQRPINAEDWQEVTTLAIRARKLEGFARQHSWDFPSRGRWQIRLTMLTTESTDSKVMRKTTWAALQTLRPEYPLNYGRPLALVAVRVKATHQLSGSLDNLNAVGARHCLDHDHATGTWIERPSSNPAAIYRHVLQSPANPARVADAGIDLDQLAEWHDFCRGMGLKYDRVLDQAGTTMREVLAEIAAAGRATPRHDGIRWGVVIDRPDGLIVDHIGPRNSWAFKHHRSYADPPHAFRVAFLDATNDYKPAERLVRWPGYDGEITRTEALSLPGKTDPSEIWRAARRRMYEAIHRPDSYQVTQDGPARVVTRGDIVTLSQPVLDRTQVVARARAVAGSLLELDETVTMDAADSYAIRFRVFDAGDPIGRSVVRPVAAVAGETEVLTVDPDGDMPAPGDLVAFGRAGEETFRMLVTGIEPAEDMASILHMVDAAPIIDELLAADAVPDWSGRVGTEVEFSQLAPPAPHWRSIVSGVAATGTANRVDYLLEPGSSTIATMRYRIAHRRAGTSTWTEIEIQAANGGGSLTSYAARTSIEMRAQAVSVAGTPGPWTATIPLIIGSADIGVPYGLDPAAISITTLLGGALVQLATGPDANTARLQLYLSPLPELDRAADAVGTPMTVGPLQSYSLSVGDLTRQNLIVRSAWDPDPEWAVTDDGLVHQTGGVPNNIRHPLDLVAGRWYRVSFVVAGQTGGWLRPALAGGDYVAGADVVQDGHHTARLQAVAGNDMFLFRAGGAFDGIISQVVVYAETEACLATGRHYLWIEPQNDDAIPGPVSGPFAIDVI